MSETHTPGPWYVNQTPPHDGRPEVWSDVANNGKGQLVARSETMYASPEQAVDDPDAHLIAAAPDLLEACRAGLESLVSLWRSEFECDVNRTPEDADDAVEQLRAAIAKARGQSVGAGS